MEQNSRVVLLSLSKNPFPFQEEAAGALWELEVLVKESGNMECKRMRKQEREDWVHRAR